MDDLLRIEDLRVSYYERGRTVRAVDGVSLALAAGRTLALVGESGCGKTTTALAALNLVAPPGRIDSGRVMFEGRDLLRLRGRALRDVRGARVALIFQDATAGLDPVMTVGEQIAEAVRSHRRLSRGEARAVALAALAQLQVAQPERVAAAYPFQLSGGLCQRVMIAIATVLRPRVLIADEPTASLDVTVQAAILRELARLRDSLGAGLLLITHDFGVVAQLADEVAVMYAGRIIEQAPAAEVYARPRHPYTAALMAARPRLDQPGRPLRPIAGAPPDLAALGEGCAFLPRCTKALSACRSEPWPALRELAPAHAAACLNPVFQPEPQPA